MEDPLHLESTNFHCTNFGLFCNSLIEKCTSSGVNHWIFYTRSGVTSAIRVWWTNIFRCLRVRLSVVLSAIVFIHWTDHGSTIFIQFCRWLSTFLLGDAALVGAPFLDVCFLSRPATLVGASFDNVSPFLRILVGLMGFEVISSLFLWLSLSSTSSIFSMHKTEYLLYNDLSGITGEVDDQLSIVLFENPLWPW